MNNPEMILDGESLDPIALHAVSQEFEQGAPRTRISIAQKSWQRIEQAAAFVHRVVQKNAPVYGINTGFGEFAEVSISNDQLQTLQQNLIVSHAAGVGPLLSRSIVAAMWILRLNTLCRGNSGIQRGTVETVLAMLNAGVLAEVPSQGSVGASGDLAPSAHATLALLGMGHVTLPIGGTIQRRPAAEALQLLKLSPRVLAPKEGLALINGTQTTAALAISGAALGMHLLRWANLNTAMSVEGLRAAHGVFDSKIFEARNHSSASLCAQNIRAWLQSPSEISRSHENCGRVQDPYSIRCAAQVHGSVLLELQRALETIQCEINSSTDNPLLFCETEQSLSGGNFHAIYVARACDNLSSALTTLSAISERRIALFMDQKTSLLPPFLAKNGGLNSGLMMAQVTAAALVSENKSLSFPASVDTIPTSGDREDHVSMGPIAGRKLQQIVQNTSRVLAVELLAACQAIDFLRPLKASEKLENIHRALRAKVSFMDSDRVLSTDIESVFEFAMHHPLEPQHA